MIQVTKVRIEGAEGKSEYCAMFPKEFTSLEEANQFLVANQHYHTERGYYKHNITVFWGDEDYYKYRADLCAPRGNCYHSLEYNIGARIKQGALYYLSEYEKGVYPEGTEEYEFLTRICSGEFELSNLTEVQLYAIEEIDSVIRKSNNFRMENEDKLVELENHIATAYDKTEVTHSKKETSFEIARGSYHEGKTTKVTYCAGKTGYIIIEGESKDKNPVTGETITYPCRKVFTVGDKGTADYDDECGEIVSITAKSVMIEGNFYKGSRKRLTVDFFARMNTPY